ncbi:MAG: tRNA1(Val) (adenine(37)-N6)-methyltransferase [Acetobacteraceae bacterium]
MTPRALATPCRAGEPAIRNTSEGWLLGGRVRYRQPDEGFRSGIEPVLLAASVPAMPTDRVLEAGTGAGAGLLCLAARVPGVGGTGVERDPALANLAGWNFAANGFTALSAVAADIESPEAGLAKGELFDHAFANPPWHPATGTAPHHPAKTAAKRGGEKLGAWITALVSRLRPRGTLCLVLPAAQVPQALAAAAQSGSPLLFPLWPKQGRAAKLVLLRVTQGGHGPLRLLAGLVLHREDGRFTAAAEAILRDGAALDI